MTKQQLKMSDVFKHPDKFALNSTCLISGLQSRIKLTPEQQRHVNHAVKVHDQQQELINELTEALERAMIAFRNQAELDIIHPNYKKESEDLADELFIAITKAKGGE